MNEHVKRLKQVANLLDETQNGMAAVGVDKAVEYLTSLEQRAAELEQALRESTNVLLETKPYQFFVSRSETARQVADCIAANERLLGGSA